MANDFSCYNVTWMWMKLESLLENKKKTFGIRTKIPMEKKKVYEPLYI